MLFRSYLSFPFLSSASHISHSSPQKSLHHQAGVVHATTHRLFYIDNAHPFSRSFSLDLRHVARTEYYAGLFTSSSKVTLYLNPLPPREQPQELPSTSTASAITPPSRSTPSVDVEFWECEVCSNRNPIGVTSSAICSLCGVPRASIKAPINIPTKSSSAPPHSLSTSLPSSSVNLGKLSLSNSPSPSPPVIVATNSADEIACTACTFLNSPLLRECEMCGTPLPRPAAQPPVLPAAKSAPASRAVTPAPDSDLDSDDDAPEKRMIRLSFRKGGDKPFYSVLRRCLLGKAWEVRTFLAP